MLFNGNNQNTVVGLTLCGMSLSLSIAIVIMDIINEAALALPTSIMLIVGSILFGIGTVLLMLNSREVGGDSSKVDISASNMIQYVFLGSMFLLVLAGIFVTL